VGETMMIHFKRKYDRPRPPQVCPTLFPPVGVPNHGSYPAGHALIGQLTSLCLIDVVPHRKKALLELARRAGFNRVIAGLHYESDCDAGVELANKIHPILKQCATYQLVLNEINARKEFLHQ
jgi:acid phosphatase (class A)